MTLREAPSITPHWVMNQLASDEVAKIDVETGDWYGVLGDVTRKLGRVVHVQHASYDVYVGRGRCPKTGKPSIWGNPFIVGQHGSRGDCVILHREWLPTTGLQHHLEELRGKTLGCWCAPELCHAETLVYLANRPVRKAA